MTFLLFLTVSEPAGPFSAAVIKMPFWVEGRPGRGGDRFDWKPLFDFLGPGLEASPLPNESKEVRWWLTEAPSQTLILPGVRLPTRPGAAGRVAVERSRLCSNNTEGGVAR
jgi:hypothetical protein